MTPEQRAAAKARCDALRIENDPFTNGAPWEFIDDIVWGGNGDLIAGGEDTAATNAELRFIAHARTDLPEALALLDKYEKALREIKEWATCGSCNGTGTASGNSTPEDDDDLCAKCDEGFKSHAGMIARDALREAVNDQ